MLIFFNDIHVFLVPIILHKIYVCFWQNYEPFCSFTWGSLFLLASKDSSIAVCLLWRTLEWIIQVIHRLQHHGTVLWNPQFITSSQHYALFQHNALLTLWMKNFMGCLHVIWDHTPSGPRVLDRIGVCTQNLPFSFLTSTFYFCPSHFFFFLRPSLTGVLCSVFQITLSSTYFLPYGCSMEEKWWHRNKTTCPTLTWENI